mgnify:CR=1 FL=1
MKKLLGIVVLGLLCCNVSYAKIIEFNKCYPKKINSFLYPDVTSTNSSWNEYIEDIGLGKEWGGVKGAEITYEDIVFSIDTTTGIVIFSKIHTDEHLEGMNNELKEMTTKSMKKWQEGGKKGIRPTTQFLTKILKTRYRLLEYTAGHISFDDPEYDGTLVKIIFDLNISEATVHEAFTSDIFVQTTIWQCEGSYNSGTETASSSGTAFFINSSGNLLTNHHVVDKCKQLKINYFDKEYEAQLIAKDKTLDLALLKVDVRPKSHINFSNYNPKKLQKIYVAGYPFGKGLSDDLKISSGIISSLKGAEDNSNELQIDAAINHGNSGGPIVGEGGELIGIAVSGLAKEVSEGINFGIKSSAVLNFLGANDIDPSRVNKSSMNSDKLLKILEESTLFISCTY